ncbi:MAG: DUF4389 domain-containing protein [Halioglobus sp.]|nr:DUF4389 domain-containing protein [Halioglobus sp.]
MSGENETNMPDSGLGEGFPKTVKDKDWKRIIVVILLCIALYLEVVYAAFLLVLASIVLYLINGSVDPRVSHFSGALITVVSDTLRYVLLQADDKPWPLTPWPSTEESQSTDSVVVAEDVTQQTVQDVGKAPREV